MMRIPAGSYLMGSDAFYPEEGPVHEVQVAEFELDAHPVTNAQFAAALGRVMHRPAFIEAFPSALYPLARWLAAHPMPEFTREVKGVMLYSANVYGFQMEKFREVFRCPILSHYGHSERVLAAASMPDDDRYFFWPRYGHFELLDAENRPVTQPGKLGFVVGTSYDNKVMPFVRYRTGDLAVLSDRGHPLLPGYPACERIVGFQARPADALPGRVGHARSERADQSGRFRQLLVALPRAVGEEALVLEDRDHDRLAAERRGLFLE